jgi:hypothetical protein
MVRSMCFAPTAVAALAWTVSGGNAAASDATAVDTTQKTTPEGATMVALVALEKSAYMAWNSKDAGFWGSFLSDRFVGWGSSGRLDKSSATIEYTGADCTIRSYALSDEQIRPLGKGAALITHKITVDGTCGGRKVPPESWAASVYVRDADKWQAAFHAEAPIVDPKAALAKSVDHRRGQQKDQAQPTATDTNTRALLSVERSVWEAWRAHDGKHLADLTANSISFINIFGTYFPSKADALKDWTATGCDVKSVSVTHAARTLLSPTTQILTFTATADGTCYGQDVNSVVWGTSVYVKRADTWEWTFGINVPALREGT